MGGRAIAPAVQSAITGTPARLTRMSTASPLLGTSSPSRILQTMESAVAMEMGNTSFLWTGCHSSRVESSAIRRSMCLAAVILLRLLLQPQLLLRHRPRLLLRGQSHPLPLSLQPQLLQTLLRPKLLLGLRPQLLLR